MSRSSNTFKPGFGTHKFGSNYWQGAIPDPDGSVELLDNGNSISVFGMERSGKSSLLAETRERLRRKGRLVFWIDLETHNSIASVLKSILISISENAEGIAQNLLSTILNADIFPRELKIKMNALLSERIDVLADSDIAELADVFFELIRSQFSSIDAANKPIIIFDELSHMLITTINNADKDEMHKVVVKLNTFLGMLRQWRSDDVGVAMAICGSTSIDWVRRKFGIEDAMINDCMRISVKEMSKSEAEALIEVCISADTPLNWTKKCTNQLLSILPAYYSGVIQLAYNVIRSEDASIEALRGTLRIEIENALKDKYYRQYARLYLDYSEVDQRRIKNLLVSISENKTGFLTIDTALQKLNATVGQETTEKSSGALLSDLESDGFIVSTTQEGISFSTGLVGAWLTKCTPFNGS